ncbi:GNAT family N-acetyltransferase [Erysipelothrix sp. HDW6A]|uniref:GNAT family N-acetyltransferase n=1 Tax=Erysipelothrix sp. HDW6A TaxID=2714928 RepID=UPI00140C041E|nr:GNAT family N-acetyltransferase [Erysipelothrix sp. HDW6A]QIK57430.1 GNAT family N-acetyltransferase [Erysipelothrix sp. HDW6A]
MENQFSVRRFSQGDEETLVQVIRENLTQINQHDYGIESMNELAVSFTPQKILRQSLLGNMYVGVDDDTNEVIACVTIAPFFESKTESILLSFFVDVRYHRKGIGRLLFNAIKNDSYYLRARRIEVPSSLYAEKFYLKLGFEYKNKIRSLDSQNYVRMEILR